MRYRLLAALLIALVQSGSALPPRVAIVRATAHAFDDHEISVMVQVLPDERNRVLWVAVVDGDVVATSTLKQLTAESRTLEITWKRVPAGADMLIVATLYGDDGKVVARAQRSITVLSRR
jgi:nucleoid-associated protein YgaU